MHVLMTIDTMLLVDVLLASPHSTSQTSNEAAASLPLQSVCTVMHNFIPIASKYIGTQEAANALFVTTESILLVEVLLTDLYWTSQISYEAVAFRLRNAA